MYKELYGLNSSPNFLKLQLQPVKSPNVSNFPHQFDVLIVGGGAAGLYAALCLPPHLQVGLVTKDTLLVSASEWAQGGIAAAIATDDSPSLHLQDTLRAGAGLCEPAAVDFLVTHAPECIQTLVNMGVTFDRNVNGSLALTLEAAHSQRRVLHSADTTGHALITTLTQQVVSRSNIQVISQTFVLNLWLNPQTLRCQGVCLICEGEILWIRAKAVILATGGGGQVYAQTTNPASSTGDGIAIAWRAGAEIRDLEFMQFHPTALAKPGAPRFLISEAVRGEGAHLVDDQGQRFAFTYHPKGELAPRDIVSRAIYSHLQQLAKINPEAPKHVWLDLRPIPPETIDHRFPNIIQVCRQWGIDLFHEPIPVAPAAHYWMGGITTNLHGQTTIPGLYALGETASTGIHGANRLASNSLLECIVFGQQMANLAWVTTDYSIDHSTAIDAAAPDMFDFWDLNGQDWNSQFQMIEGIRAALPELMWECAGICRQQSDLEAAIAQVGAWRQAFVALPLSQGLSNLKPQQTVFLKDFSQPLKIAPDCNPLLWKDPTSVLRTWSETLNLLDIATLTLRSALFRTESRGGHYRSDYPQTDAQWQAHTLIQQHRIWKSTPILTR
jgi:L-aspartate oxidase